MSEAFIINGHVIGPGQRVTLDLPVARLYTHSPITMPLHVIRGRKSGPRLFLSAAIHGDEINGVEIIRRVLRLPLLRRLRGTLLAVPIVNVHGFINHSRYLPDRRDLNRSFPGSKSGSLTARLADLFMQEIVYNATHGIDIHTGALHRSNLPQIRADLDDGETERLARAFHVPVLLNSSLRDGSLRELAAEHGIPMLLYEAGEALRFDELSIRAGVRGVISVMRALEMLPPSKYARRRSYEPILARSSAWVRAPESGILRVLAPLGARVKRGEVLGVVADPFGEQEHDVRAAANGIIIGRVNLPLVNEGDALFHLARFEKTGEAAAQVEAFHNEQQLPLGTANNEPPIE
ncbi:MAG TPA: succinylglutamate desuccinylase/aspartoacylase family protein [Gammaproteobacteria bacterium]|nr:succinylglutamate desuccinylase/aspartoacylase family protein [Gammaproteobacteria bacterium]